jgi:hypothetical protein
VYPVFGETIRPAGRQLYAAVAAIALCGCGHGDQPVRQKGRVTLDGVPLAHFNVTFMADNNGRPAWGKTGETGEFELTTFEAGDGILPGRYRVVLSPPMVFVQEGAPRAPVVRGPDNRPVPTLHPNYLDPLRTPLLREVPAPEGRIELSLTKTGT